MERWIGQVDEDTPGHFPRNVGCTCGCHLASSTGQVESFGKVSVDSFTVDFDLNFNSLPEIDPDFDDSSFVDADLTSTNVNAFYHKK